MNCLRPFGSVFVTQGKGELDAIPLIQIDFF